MKMKEQQFAQFVSENKSTVYAVCYMFSDDNEEVADLFQKVLINLWKGFDSFRKDSSCRTWVYRVALNTCISLNRKRNNRSSSTNLNMQYNTQSASRGAHRLAAFVMRYEWRKNNFAPPQGRKYVYKLWPLVCGGARCCASTA